MDNKLNKKDAEDTVIKLFQTATIAEMQATEAMVSQKVQPFESRLETVEAQRQLLVKTIEALQSEIAELKKERTDLQTRLKTEESVSAKVLKDNENLAKTLLETQKTVQDQKTFLNTMDIQVKNIAQSLDPAALKRAGEFFNMLDAFTNKK